MSKACVNCNYDAGFLNRRQIADKKYVCEVCFKDAKTLTLGQITRLKRVTADEIKASIEATVGTRAEVVARLTEAPQVESTTKTKCPSCNSLDIQFLQNNKKAFSVGKAAGGAILTGGVGVLAGFAGKKGNDQWRCNNCGEMFATQRKK